MDEITEKLGNDLMNVIALIASNVSSGNAKRGLVVDIKLKNGESLFKKIININEEALLFSSFDGHLGCLPFNKITGVEIVNSELIKGNS